jgi:pyruvate ferredoxin oxidoreductase beta subunit
VEEYLKLQGRFRHLFEPIRQEEAIQHTQNRVTAYWTGVGK